MEQSQSCTEKDKWRVDMTSKIKNANTNAETNGFNESRIISKPPKALLDVRKQSYCPQILTIGPLHELLGGSSSLDERKALCVKRFMERHGISDVEELMLRLFEDSSDLRLDYSDLPDYSDEALQLLVTVDTVFLCEFLIFVPTDWASILKEHDYFDILCDNDIAINQVWKDLVVMGNQIPMSFLMTFIEVFPSKDKSNKEDKLEKGLLYVVQQVDPFKNSEDENSDDEDCSDDENLEILDFCERSHLLDCLYVWVLRKRSRGSDTSGTERAAFSSGLGLDTSETEQAAFISDPVQDTSGTEQEAEKEEEESHNINIRRDRLPTSSQLSKAGIRFKAIEGGSISMMEYDKRKLCLHLPRLVVEHGTEDVFRNLLAHEQTFKEGGEFTMYLIIMDSLIDTAEDVAILTKARVIENHLGSDEKLFQMWNDMCTNIKIRECETWDDMIRDILQHCKSHWRPMYVEFREKYFSRPWLTISLIVGFLLLLFSALQTGYTVAGYYRKDNPSAPPPK